MKHPPNLGLSRMDKPILLDAGPLGRIAHPRRSPEISKWYRQMLAAGREVLISEVADYEVRREFLFRSLTPSLARLDALQRVHIYLPISTATMRKAAELWAEARKAGQPTADPKEVDFDVLLAAQALEVGAIVVTGNICHLARFVEARHWQDITL